MKGEAGKKGDIKTLGCGGGGPRGGDWGTCTC